MTPEHLHVAINHIPLIGCALALLPLLIGLIGRRKESLAIGLLLAAVSAGTIPVVMWSGETAEHDWLHSPTAVGLDEAAYEWAHEHEERAELGAKLIYVTAGLAVLGLVSFRIKKWPKAVWVLGVLTALGCVATVGVAAWIADAGGKINHPEFRDASTPALTEDS